MAHKKSYSRYFIILQEDEKGCGLSKDKQPSGYTKIEIKNDKCKITFYVQNLRKDKEPYYMVLVCNKKETKKLINMGVLNIDDHGRAEFTFESNIDNIGDTAMAVDRIGGAAIYKNINNKMIIPMSGFSSTEMPSDWKDYEIIPCFNKDIEEANVPEEIVEEVKAEVQEEVQEVFKEDKIEAVEEETRGELEGEEIQEEQPAEEEPREEEEDRESSQQENLSQEDNEEQTRHKKGKKHKDIIKEITKDISKDINEEKNIFEEYEDLIEKEKKNMIIEFTKEEKYIIESECKEEKHHHEDECKEEKHHHEDECKEEKHEHKHKENHHECKEEYPVGSIGEFFEAVADGFERIHDVCVEIKRCKWYKIPVANLDVMCNLSNYNKYTIIYYPMINYYPYIKKHGHYMVGFKSDSLGRTKYIVYAIPGTKDRAEQPYGGKSGFVTWVPTYGTDNNVEMGYWVMFYDFRNSMIVVPMR